MKKRDKIIALIFAALVFLVLYQYCSFVERQTQQQVAPVGIGQWTQLRSNPDKYMGNPVSWRLYVSFMAGDLVICRFSNQFTYEICHCEVRLVEIPTLNIHEGDWIIVNGTFVGISADGKVVIKPSEIKNEGYGGQAK